ncbi:helix-turn-helix domain-containing protein [Nocardia bovistercoris]|uniref:Helix-turn-helix transcriptional regulator n=1 Tax=Nocardia bovistercoris TaxID=2785916 RepID=A0A931IJB2_9NOCA|nr:helix-turn-helix transcriptional regulator [Nocardia bovistercoris]MBH0781350.1 helix-turn-helix transcriptional regulator [Nocardia bovistercoris]
MTEKRTGHVVGLNLKRIRVKAGDSQSECAQRVSAFGLNWAQSHVSSLESGNRKSVSIEELLILSDAYKVQLHEWFDGDGFVDLNDEYTVSRSDIQHALKGEADHDASRVLDFRNDVRLPADESIAVRLDIDRDVVIGIACELWGHTATEERDKRLAHHGTKDPAAMRNLRGGMTKRLANEIKLHREESGTS